jgi:DNA-binding cell septation regulator SpoVG
MIRKISQMIKLNDHYFIAWLKIVKGYPIVKKAEGIYVEMTPENYSKGLTEYENTHKPVLKEIRKVVKELASFTSKHKCVNKK